MATGRRAFEGKSKTSLIAAILASQPPPISSVQPVMPPALDHVVTQVPGEGPGRPLAERPRRRERAALDRRGRLAGGRADDADAAPPQPRAARPGSWPPRFGRGDRGGLGWALQLRRAAREADRPLPGRAGPAPGRPTRRGRAGALALSPDGRRLAFVVGEPARSRASRSAISASGETKRLAGTDGATFPFWSPDSRWLAFFAEGRLKKVEAAGGPVQVVCDAHAGRGGSLGPGRHDRLRPRHHGSAREGSRRAAARPRRRHARPTRSVTHRNPWFLPDGRHFLFTARETRSASFGARRRRLPGRRRAEDPPGAGLESRSTPTASSSPSSTATCSRSASTPPSSPSRDRRCRSPRPSSTGTRATSPTSPVSRRASSPTAGSVCGGRSSSGSTAPARSSAAVGEPSYYAGLQPRRRRPHPGRRPLGLRGRQRRRLDARPAALPGDAVDVRVRPERHLRRGLAGRRPGWRSRPPPSAAGPGRPSGSSRPRAAARARPLLEKGSFNVAAVVAGRRLPHRRHAGGRVGLRRRLRGR